MKQYFSKGLAFGLGFVAILGAYLYVQAVAPGAISNPTFGPSDDDVQLSFALECVTGANIEGGTSINPSSTGVTYPFNQVFTAVAPSTLTCINGWTLTGCSSSSSGSDSDESMSGQNTCSGENESGAVDYGFARCCRVGQ